MSKPITAWSYSRLSVFRKCPRQFKYKFIDKIPTEDNYASSRGSLLHAKCEQIVNGNIKGIPKELKPFSYELRELKRLQADTEMDLSVTRSWEPTHTKDWDGVWCRASLDAVVQEDAVCSIIDYKTGKIYEKDHEEQGKLYASCAFAHFPEVEVVDVEMWYLDQEDVLTWQYTSDQFESLKKYWKKLSTPMFRETKYAPSTGNHCRWCPFVENCKREKGNVALF